MLVHYIVAESEQQPICALHAAGSIHAIKVRPESPLYAVPDQRQGRFVR